MIFARQAKSFVLEVPDEDWTRVKVGQAREFRTGGVKRSINTPTPVVLYRERGDDREDSKLMLLEAHRFEPLFALADDPAACRRAGYDSYEFFRRAWRAHHDGHYAPMTMVNVWAVRPFMDSDIIVQGAKVLRELYGPWLPSEKERERVADL